MPPAHQTRRDLELFFSHEPSSPKYHGYCRMHLVTYEAWQGGVRKEWRGSDGETVGTENQVARDDIISHRNEHAISVLQSFVSGRPYRFSASDLAAERRFGRAGDNRAELEEEGSATTTSTAALTFCTARGQPELRDGVVGT